MSKPLHIIDTPPSQYQQGRTFQHQGAEWMADERHRLAGEDLARIGRQMMRESSAEQKPRPVAVKSYTPVDRLPRQAYKWPTIFTTVAIVCISTFFFEYVTLPGIEKVINWILS